MGLDWCIIQPKVQHMTRSRKRKLEKKKNSDDDDDDESKLIVCERIGSYSGVHFLRYCWINACITHLYANDKGWLMAMLKKISICSNDLLPLITEYYVEPIIELIIENLKTWISSCSSYLNSSLLYYQNMPETIDDPFIKILKKNNLLGLWYFVYHSDCEGEYSTMESREILKTYKLISPFLDKDVLKWGNSSILIILEASIKHNLPIIFT